MPAKATADDSRSLAKHRLPKRRQWGTDKYTGAAPIMHKVPNRRTLSMARFAIVFTIAAWLGYIVERAIGAGRTADGWRDWVETSVYVVIVTLLTSAALAYLISRLGHLVRVSEHHRTPRAVIDTFFAESIPTLTVIVPSYREDKRVIWQTMMSAGLQEHPQLKVVLLIDDPPNPSDAEHIRILEESREVPNELAALFEEPRSRFEAALEEFESAQADDEVDDEFAGAAEIERLADFYEDAAEWFVARAEEHEIVDHSDVFLIDDVYMRMQAECESHASALRSAVDSGSRLSRQRVQKLYRRLAWTFSTEFTSFERKQFASLSHEPNKAMNLNSYIGLMGGSYRVESTPAGPVLLPMRDGADLAIPETDYILTLDADSTLLPEYCLRLVHFMEQTENQDVAVIQTPYSSYRGAPTRVERIAGATTDLQHLVHQGLTHHDADFWVGANAIIRKQALESIKEEENLGGFTIRRYIQDRTVIEDTESSLDMRREGWRLYNYPERLSYSATPPDFGSLAIQRQRWSNGGLVMFPKLWNLLRPKSANTKKITWMEGMLRANYLASIAWVSVGLIMLLVYPFDQELFSPLAVFTALPYFAMQASDLRRVGYKRRDLFRLYGLNLLLLPVNMSGVLKSIAQAIGGQKIAFARTPKVRNRTATRVTFLIVPVLIVLWSIYALILDIRNEHWIHAGFAALNGGLTLYALMAFVGVRALVVDLVYGVFENILVPTRSIESEREAPGWATLLYHGSPVTGESDHADAMASALSAVDQQANGERMELKEQPVAHPMRRRSDRLGFGGHEHAAAEPEPRWHPMRRRSDNGARTNGDSASHGTDALAEALIRQLTATPGAESVTVRLDADGGVEIHLSANGDTEKEHVEVAAAPQRGEAKPAAGDSTGEES